MQHFECFIARHGEIAVQAIIENLERFEGVGATCAQSLEERWARLMQTTDQQSLAA